MAWLVRQYQRRIVNINVNIIAAGLLALLPTVVVVHFATIWLGFPPPDQKTNQQKLISGAITFATDIAFDVAIYYLLHWLANHYPRKLPRRERLAEKSEELAQAANFFKDATQVQVERMALSPLFYVIALGGQQGLMHAHLSASTSAGISFGVAILTTRVIHTWWMLRQDRRRRALLSAAGTPATVEPDGDVVPAPRPDSLRQDGPRQDSARPDPARAPRREPTAPPAA